MKKINLLVHFVELGDWMSTHIEVSFKIKGDQNRNKNTINCSKLECF